MTMFGKMDGAFVCVREGHFKLKESYSIGN